MVLIRDMGMSLGEMFDLEALADDCAADGVWEFLFSAPVLKVSRAPWAPPSTPSPSSSDPIPVGTGMQSAFCATRHFVRVVLRLLGWAGGKKVDHKNTGGCSRQAGRIRPLLPGRRRMSRGRYTRRAIALTAGFAFAIGVLAPMSVSAAATKTAASPKISVTSFTSDFAAMAGLKSLAKKGKGKVVALLPDTQSSARYVQYDEPFLKQAFAAAGLSSDDFQVQNAQGSASTMQTQAEAAITNGASVLLIDPIDSGSGAAIESNATSKGVKSIDYDRLTLNGSASYYVSFDNVKVGQSIGKGFVDCVTRGT